MHATACRMALLKAPLTREESPIVVSDRNQKRVAVTVHGFCDYYAQRTLAREDELVVSTARPNQHPEGLLHLARAAPPFVRVCDGYERRRATEPGIKPVLVGYIARCSRLWLPRRSRTSKQTLCPIICLILRDRVRGRFASSR